MKITTAASDWRLIGDVPRRVIIQDLHTVASPMLDDINATYEAAKPHSALFFAQAWIENKYETTGHIIKPKDHNPVSLRPEVNGELGPYGYGIIRAPDGGQFLAFKTDADCAREWQRRLITEALSYKGGVYARTRTLADLLKVYAPPGDVHPVTGLDNKDIGYAAGVLAVLSRYEMTEQELLAPAPQPVGKEPQMSFTAHQFVGLARPVYLPSDIPFRKSIVPAGVFQVRSNQKRAASVVTKVTRHETANRKVGANAKMHERYLHGGPRDEYGKPIYAGYNCVSDDVEIIQLTPYDEVTWAAGNELGNLISDHHELCVNDGIDHAKARRISAALDAGVIHARGLTVEQALEQHNYWTGKNCPKMLRELGLWAWYINQVKQFYNAIVAHVAGKPATMPGTQPGLFVKGARVITTDALNMRGGSGIKYEVLAVLPAGVEGEIIDGPRVADGYTWVDIKGAYKQTGWVATDWLSVLPPVDTKPSNAWPYPDPVMPAWWSDLQKDTHIIDGGMLWFRSNDLYRVIRDTKRLRTAVGSSDEVGPILKKGEMFRDAAKGQSALDKRAYVITDGGTRVALDDLEFVQED